MGLSAERRVQTLLPSFLRMSSSVPSVPSIILKGLRRLCFGFSALDSKSRVRWGHHGFEIIRVVPMMTLKVSWISTRRRYSSCTFQLDAGLHPNPNRPCIFVEKQGAAAASLATVGRDGDHDSDSFSWRECYQAPLSRLEALQHSSQLKGPCIKRSSES